MTPVRIFSGVEIERVGTATSDETWWLLQQITTTWPSAVLDLGTDIVTVCELASLPERKIYVVYQGRPSLLQWRRFEGDPDPSCWIRMEIRAESVMFTVDAWGSASGKIVRRIVGIDR